MLYAFVLGSPVEESEGDGILLPSVGDVYSCEFINPNKANFQHTTGCQTLDSNHVGSSSLKIVINEISYFPAPLG